MLKHDAKYVPIKLVNSSYSVQTLLVQTLLDCLRCVLLIQGWGGGGRTAAKYETCYNMASSIQGGGYA